MASICAASCRHFPSCPHTLQAWVHVVREGCEPQRCEQNLLKPIEDHRKTLQNAVVLLTWRLARREETAGPNRRLFVCPPGGGHSAVRPQGGPRTPVPCTSQLRLATRLRPLVAAADQMAMPRPRRTATAAASPPSAAALRRRPDWTPARHLSSCQSLIKGADTLGECFCCG